MFKTVKETANEWGISTRRVAILCAENRISAKKVGGSWLIQKDAKKPKDIRCKIEKEAI
jgi:hypothetical protein